MCQFDRFPRNLLLRGGGVWLSSLGSYPRDRWFKSNPRNQTLNGDCRDHQRKT